MKLLITTQAVDLNDPVLGFFHRWIEEFSKHCEKVTVICLREGNYQLPANVEVCSLSEKLKAESYQLKALRRLRIIIHFYVLLWRKRRSYDAVFVHMNPEYAVLGSIMWRLFGKKIGLWYVHKSVNIKLRMATLFVHVVFTASRESFRFKTRKLRIVGHGIDTNFFAPEVAVPRESFLLSVGRLMPSKRHDIAIRAIARVKRELHIAGEGPERKNLEQLAQQLGAQVVFLGGLTQDKLRDEYRKATCLIHTSETGSLDKVVLEALACGTQVISTSEAFKSFPVFYSSPDPDDISASIEMMKNPKDPRMLTELITREHSLSGCISRIRKALK